MIANNDWVRMLKWRAPTIDFTNNSPALQWSGLARIHSGAVCSQRNHPRCLEGHLERWVIGTLVDDADKLMANDVIEPAHERRQCINLTRRVEAWNSELRWPHPGTYPFRMCRSVEHIPARITLMRASPGPGSGMPVSKSAVRWDIWPCPMSHRHA